MAAATAPQTSRLTFRLLPLLLVSLFAGCATGPHQSSPAYAVHDPGERFNQRIFNSTERLDKRVMRPIALGYRRVVPGPLRSGVRNFFSNLRGVDSALNGFLQAKPKRGFTDVGRVLVNTTLGLGGLFDPATRLGLDFQDEDFGQTLAVWGYSETAYLYLPVVGPLTVRDLPTLVLRFAWPEFILGEYYNVATVSLDVIAQREAALGLSDARDAAALSPYVFTREAYYQRRRFQIYDGEPPPESLLEGFDEFEELDDFDDSATEEDK